jgi:signal transduction histidine kinase
MGANHDGLHARFSSGCRFYRGSGRAGLRCRVPPPGGLGPFRLLLRIVAARRGDPRAKEDLYHLRGVLTFVAVFAATIAFPGVLLSYYGLAGIAAQRDAAQAQVARDAEIAADTLSQRIEAEFVAFEVAALTRLQTGKSLHVRLAELSPAVRVVFRFDRQGTLVAPFVRSASDVGGGSPWRLSVGWAEAESADREGRHAAAAVAYGAFLRHATSVGARGDAAFAQARALVRAGEARAAEVALKDVERDFRAVRTLEGYRLGDLARYKFAELLAARDPAAGQLEFQNLIEALLAEDWVIGEGGEAEVAKAALDNLEALGGDMERLRRDRESVDERQTQLYWADVLQGELDTLGAKGRLLPQPMGKFYYVSSPGAVWARTWTATDHYWVALESDALLARLRSLARVATSAESDVGVAVLRSGDPPIPDTRVRRGLSRAPQWSIVAYARNPALLKARQSEEERRGLGIVLLAVGMIVVGTFLSARLVRRELDSARIKSEFAANVSHELRSPITQIRLKAEALQLGLAESAEARSRHYDVIVREAERLSRMVDNMLDFAAIERGVKRYNLRLGDLSLTVQNVVETARLTMETRSMAIEDVYPDDLPPVWHDTDAVAQVVVNLLSNAAKYGKEAGWIGVRVFGEATEVCVEVSDRGIGVQASELSHIFEQYYRSPDPLARGQKGTGIGLTIVKYIMEAHGGKVTVRSTPGVGTTFVLHFPIKGPPLADRQGA